MVDFPRVMYGGDYNPDQWPEEIWNEDMRLFKKAGINIVTLPVFSWAKLQPNEDTYDFGWLDRILDLVTQNGMNACLATSTAAQPAWMSKKYPDVLPVDINGHKRTHGGRVNFCPNSKVYKKFAVKLVEMLAQRYKNHPALLIWHIGNEYGNYCYCENCAQEFREWAKARYGTLEEVNKSWNLSFWGHTIYDWDEIVSPSYINEMFKGSWDGDSRDCTCFQGIAIDYNRFMSDSVLACYKGEYDVLKKFTPEIPITTNLMGTFKPLDYFKWGENMDIVSWDSYPSPTDSMSDIAFRHDLMRGLKDGQPFMLMEQTPSQQNWQPFNSLKRPGVMRLWSYQAMAHGADTIMFFQLRRSIGACEKFHGAVIEHVGHENTRVFRECAQLGEELKLIGDKVIGSRLKSKVAIVFDWENWWAVEFSSGPSVALRYVDQVEKYYKAFYDLNVSVDIVKPTADLSQYKVVVAPILYMVKPNVANNINHFVNNGGIFVTTFFSGIVNENDLVTLGGYPGELRKVLGIWSEEIDALMPGVKNSIVMKKSCGDINGSYECGLLCDLIHLETASEIASYGQDFYAGMPAITENVFGKGKAYYLATDPHQTFVNSLFKQICIDNGIKSLFDAQEGVEVTERYKCNKKYMFILNHNEYAVNIDLLEDKYHDLIKDCDVYGTIVLKARDVMILKGRI